MRLALSLMLSVGSALAAGTEAKVKLPNSRSELLRGEKLFQVHCALCHGPKGEGGRGPMLTRAKLSRAPDDAALLRILEDGIRGTEMPGRERCRTANPADGGLRAVARQGAAERGARAMRRTARRLYRGKGSCAGCHSIRRRGRRRGAGSIGNRRVAQRGVSSRIARQSGGGRARGVSAGDGGSEQRAARHRSAGE